MLRNLLLSSSTQMNINLFEVCWFGDEPVSLKLSVFFVKFLFKGDEQKKKVILKWADVYFLFELLFYF